jgi:gluconate kinase
MNNFRFTILINTNNTSNYQSPNETHYTQENITITTHKGSQLLILIETCYQLQPSYKELHTEQTPLRTIIYLNATPSILTEQNDQCGNQHHSHELLMMGIVVPETC